MSSETMYLTEYERERQKKIEENKRLFEFLGLKSVLDAGPVNGLEVAKPKRNYVKRPRVQLEPRRSERVSIRPAASYAESDDSSQEGADRPKAPKTNRKLSSFFSVRKTMWKPFYGQEIATCHICLVRNRQPKTKCSRCYADYWRGHVCRQCYETHFTSDEFEPFDEARENANWICFVCRGICTCKFCRVGSTKRGKRYTKKRPTDDEEAQGQGQLVQVKEERESDDSQSFTPKKRGRGRPPKARLLSENGQFLLTGPPDDESYDGSCNGSMMFEEDFDPQQLHHLEQLEQLEQLEEQLNQMEQLEQLQQLEKFERDQELRAQTGASPCAQELVPHAQALLPAPQQQQPAQSTQPPATKRRRGRPPKNPLQQQHKRQKHEQMHRQHKLLQQQQQHEQQEQHEQQQHERSSKRRHKSRRDHDFIDDQVQVKEEPIATEDSDLMQEANATSAALEQSAMMQEHLHEHMLMLPEHPLLHEHILQDIPPLQDPHSLQLPMLHAPLQDMPHDHGLQDQLYAHHLSQQLFRPYPHNLMNSPHAQYPSPHHLLMPPPSAHNAYAHVSSPAPATSQSGCGHHFSSFGHFNNLLGSNNLLLDGPLFQPYFLPPYFSSSAYQQQGNHSEQYQTEQAAPEHHFQTFDRLPSSYEQTANGHSHGHINGNAAHANGNGIAHHVNGNGNSASHKSSAPSHFDFHEHQQHESVQQQPHPHHLSQEEVISHPTTANGSELSNGAAASVPLDPQFSNFHLKEHHHSDPHPHTHSHA